MTHPSAHQTYFFGALGSIIRKGESFDAWKDGFWMGRFRSFDEATEELVWREKMKFPEAAQGLSLT